MCKYVGWIALLLTVVGALNWGLWGFFQFDLVAMLCNGNTTLLARVVYSIVGLAGLLTLKKVFCCSKKCGKDKGSCSSNNDKGSSGSCR